MPGNPRLLTVAEFFTNPTEFDINLPAILKEANKRSEGDELRRGQDWSFLCGQVVGAEIPQGDHYAR